MPRRARTAFNSYDFLFMAIEAFFPASNDALNITRKIVCNWKLKKSQGPLYYCTNVKFYWHYASYVGMDEIFGHEYEITECVAIGVQKIIFGTKIAFLWIHCY